MLSVEVECLSSTAPSQSQRQGDWAPGTVTHEATAGVMTALAGVEVMHTHKGSNVSDVKSESSNDSFGLLLREAPRALPTGV